MGVGPHQQRGSLFVRFPLNGTPSSPDLATARTGVAKSGLPQREAAFGSAPAPRGLPKPPPPWRPDEGLDRCEGKTSPRTWDVARRLITVVLQRSVRLDQLRTSTATIAFTTKDSSTSASAEHSYVANSIVSTATSVPAKRSSATALAGDSGWAIALAGLPGVELVDRAGLLKHVLGIDGPVALMVLFRLGSQRGRRAHFRSRAAVSNSVASTASSPKSHSWSKPECGASIVGPCF